jgi:hypothetical protein
MAHRQQGRMTTKENVMRITYFIGAVIALILPAINSHASDATIYGVAQSLYMGDAGEVARKDYYVSMGSKQGLKKGTQLEVRRKAPTFDLVNNKAYKDVVFPIATLKVIHVENDIAVARLEKLLPFNLTPVGSPHFVLVGDLVEQKD